LTKDAETKLAAIELAAESCKKTNHVTLLSEYGTSSADDQRIRRNDILSAALVEYDKATLGDATWLENRRERERLTSDLSRTMEVGNVLLV
jgi:hypothetical protein